MKGHHDGFRMSPFGGGCLYKYYGGPVLKCKKGLFLKFFGFFSCFRGSCGQGIGPRGVAITDKIAHQETFEASPIRAGCLYIFHGGLALQVENIGFFGKNQLFGTCGLSWGHGIGPRGMPITGKVPCHEGFRMGLVFGKCHSGKAGGWGRKVKKGQFRLSGY